MDQKAQSTPDRVYKELQPYFEWNEDETSATLVLMLPGICLTSLTSNLFEFFRSHNLFATSLYVYKIISYTNTFFFERTNTYFRILINRKYKILDISGQ